MAFHIKLKQPSALSIQANPASELLGDSLNAFVDHE
jgi:hypothetical protein